MPPVTLETWQLIIFLAGLLISFFGFSAAAGKMLLAQSNKRLDEKFSAFETIRVQATKNLEDKFTALMEQHKEDAKGLQELEKEFLRFQRDLPLEYVRREDWMRNQTIIEAKLDALALKIENLQLKGLREC